MTTLADITLDWLRTRLAETPYHEGWSELACDEPRTTALARIIPRSAVQVTLEIRATPDVVTLTCWVGHLVGGEEIHFYEPSLEAAYRRAGHDLAADPSVYPPTSAGVALLVRSTLLVVREAIAADELDGDVRDIRAIDEMLQGRERERPRRAQPATSPPAPQEA